MATPAETPAPAADGLPPASMAPAPEDGGQTAATPAIENTAAAPAAQDPATPLTTDPLAALGSIWSGWMSPSPAVPAQPSAERSAPPQGDQVASAAAATANEWLAGAGKMWESAVADVGSKLQSVDTASLGEQVAVIREKSGRMLEDVSRSVQSMNLSIDQTELQKRAEVITSSTKELLEKAGQSLQQGRQDALEIFVDKEGGVEKEGKVVVAPWDTAALPEGEHKFADALRQEMLKIVVDAIYSKKKRTELFLSGMAERERFQFDFDRHSGMAMAALDADKNMRRLRAGLVPGKMKEDAFWNTYFYHVHRVRQTLVANNGVMPEAPPEEDDDDPAVLFADDGEDEELAALNSPAARAAIAEQAKEETSRNGAADGSRNWDDEIDAIFDDDE